MSKKPFPQIYAEYQILNNCLATSYQVKEQSLKRIAMDKNDIEAQSLIQKAQHDIDELGEVVSNLWADMLLHLEKEHDFKRLKNPIYAIKEKQIRDKTLKINK